MIVAATLFTVDKNIFTSGRCAACLTRFKSGEEVYNLTVDATPWKAEDDEDRQYEGYTWHRTCDEGSLAADTTTRA